jgi:hypothetical protein
MNSNSERPRRRKGFYLVLLGDSFTVGANVRQEEAYPKVLEKRLESVYGPRIQVVNSGVGGWDPLQYARYFENYGHQFEDERNATVLYDNSLAPHITAP